MLSSGIHIFSQITADNCNYMTLLLTTNSFVLTLLCLGLILSLFNPSYETKYQYCYSVGVDGSLLQEIGEDDLKDPPINMKMALHRRAFFQKLGDLNSTLLSLRSGLWEYKVLTYNNITSFCISFLMQVGMSILNFRWGGLSFLEGMKI